MITLHIEHAISDFETWRGAFDRFAEMRAKAGVRRHRVARPTDDPHYVLIDLDFDDMPSAQAFLGFLREKVWAVSEASPALAGEPQTRILDLELDSTA